MTVTGYLSVNVRKGKHSHLVLKDSADGFTSGTKVSTVVDSSSAYRLDWTPYTKFINSGRLQVRIVGKLAPSEAAGVPESGTLTITLNDGTVVQISPVEYVDDNTT